MITGQTPRPREAVIARASTRLGNDRKMSVTRMIATESQPPDGAGTVPEPGHEAQAAAPEQRDPGDEDADPEVEGRASRVRRRCRARGRPSRTDAARTVARCTPRSPGAVRTGADGGRARPRGPRARGRPRGGTRTGTAGSPGGPARTSVPRWRTNGAGWAARGGSERTWLPPLHVRVEDAVQDVRDEVREHDPGREDDHDPDGPVEVVVRDGIVRVPSRSRASRRPPRRPPCRRGAPPPSRRAPWSW